LILNGLTIINGIVEDNNRIKSIRFYFQILFFRKILLTKFFSGTTNPCPAIEIFATDSPINSPECPVYSIASSRLDFPLFNLIINEQIDPMTYIVFQIGKFISFKFLHQIFHLLDNEEIGRAPFPTVIRQEREKSVVMKTEPNNALRDMSPVSQLSQSIEESQTTPSTKDIRRDEPMLGF
jgi:hypothetical protein